MKKNSGFTLMELMTVIAIIAILGAIATPNIIKWISNQKINQAAMEVQSAIQSARIKAVKENLNSRLVFSNNREYQIFIWSRADGDFVTESAKKKLPVGITLSTGLSDGSDAVVFGPRGTTSANGTVTIDGEAGRTRQIQIEFTGNSRISG